MYKLMIADDEKMIRESISSLIDWKALDIKLIGTAKDGLEAYDMMIDQAPDIILTDIQMPGLSGLDLIREMHEINPETQFIILSGYSDFEYAKTAMQFGVRHYLVKPCNEKQIEECIREAEADFSRSKIVCLYENAGSQLPQPLQNEQSKEISGKVCQYVNENLANPKLSLKWIAENVLYMNVDYLSKKFLKEKGEKFSAYLTRSRIEKAKEMMDRPNPPKIQYIADQVGCGNNPQYFSQIFRKITGVTPSKYMSKM